MLEAQARGGMIEYNPKPWLLSLPVCIFCIYPISIFMHVVRIEIIPLYSLSYVVISLACCHVRVYIFKYKIVRQTVNFD